MNNKKGFTLIEIIICLTLISIIALITIVSINKKKNDPTDEIYSLAVDSAAVKYMSGSTELESIKENYGYRVYNIQEMIDTGYIEDLKFNSLLDEIKNKGISEDYSKIVLIYDYANNGEIDYIYPYQNNGFEFLINNFENTALLKDSSDNIKFDCLNGINKHEIYYFSEDYEKTLYEGNIDENNLICRIVSNDDYRDYSNIDETKYNKQVEFDSSGRYYLEYLLIDEDEKKHVSVNDREILVLDVSSMELTITGDKKIETSNWYTSNVRVGINGLNNINLVEYGLESKLSWNYDHNYFEENSENLSFLSNKSAESVSVSLDIKITDKNNIELLDKNLSLTNINVDSEDPQIIFDRVNGSIVKFKVNDEYSGVNTVGIYNSNNELVNYLNQTNGYYEFDLIANKDCYVKVIDNAGNENKNDFKNIPSVSVEAVEDSVFNFKVKVANVKEVKIDFDMPDVTKEISYPNFNSGISINEEAEVINNIIQPINNSYDFSFIAFQQKLVEYYGRSGISVNIFNNFRVGCNIKVITLDGDEVKYRYIVQLNAYDDNIYFKDKFFDNYNGYNASLVGQNKNGDIIFTLKYPSLDQYLFITRLGGETKQLFYSNSSKSTVYYINVIKFDDNIVSFGNYEKCWRKRITDNTCYEYRNKDKKITKECYDNYYQEYNIIENNFTPLIKEITEDYASSKFSNVSISWASFPQLSSKGYYKNMNVYLSNYKIFEKQDTTNPLALSIYRNDIFVQADGWYSFLIHHKQAGPTGGSRTDVDMFYFKDEVSITKVEN